jgi:hypothetical protein
VLVHIGLFDPAKLPVLGETAMKLMDDNSVQSNQLMGNWKESEGKPIRPSTDPTSCVEYDG